MIESLRASPARFEFFQAVRLLELAARSAPGDTAAPRGAVGEDRAPRDEVVRFRATPSLAFPAGPVRGLRAAPASGSAGRAPTAAEVEVAFLGLTGPAGVLPQHYTELVLRRQYLGDRSLRDFLDLLHHRAVSFFFRAWRKYHFPFDLEHQARAHGREDAFTVVLRSLVGRNGTHLTGREAYDDRVLVHFAGHFARRTGSAAGLASMLSGCFGFAVRVEQLVGRWLPIPRAEQSRLGGPDRAENRLGGGLALGGRVWDVASKLRLHAERLDAERYRRVQPGTPGYESLRGLARSYLGPGLELDLRLELEPGATPPLRLGGDEARGLGRDTWLATPGSRVPCEALFALDGSGG